MKALGSPTPQAGNAGPASDRARVLVGRIAGRLAGPATAVVAAVAVRLVYVVALAGTRLSDDELSFWAIAGNLAHGRGFSYQGRATAWRPPLYTAVLAAARWAGATVRMVQIGQAVIGGATPLLLFAITRRLGASRRGATLAAWIGALYPPFVYFAGRVLSENVAVALFVLALWLTLEWLERGGPRWAGLCGGAWGLSILARPTSLPAAAAAVVVGTIAWAARPRGGLARGVAGGVAVIAAGAVFVVPWMVRNAMAVGGPEPVTSNEGITLWAPNRLDAGPLKSVFNDPRYPGMQEYSVYGRAFPGIDALARARHFDFAGASEASRDRWLRSLAVTDIEARPVRFVTRTLRRAALVLLPAPDNASQTSRTGAGAKAVLWMTSGPVVVLGLVGLGALAVRRRDAAAWLMGIVAVGSLLLVAVHLPYVRYRVGGVDAVLIPVAAWLVGGSRRPSVDPAR